MQKNKQPLLAIDNISKSFNVRRGVLSSAASLQALSEVCLELWPGETLGLVGESGCGKSTLARIVTGLLPADNGEIRLKGQKVESAGAQGIQMIFQDSSSALNPRRSVGASVREPLDIAQPHLPLAQRQAEALGMLELVGLRPEQAGLFPHEFSGGQRQRVVAARALVCKPEVVVCDEPVASLDASVQAQVLNLLQDLQEKFNLSYLFISHDLDVVGHMSDRVAVMYLGRVVELARVADLLLAPAHPYTKALLCARPGERAQYSKNKSETEPEIGPKNEQLKANPPANFLASSPLKQQGIQGWVELAGDLPSPLHMPAGCSLHPRCPFAMPVCKQRRPELLPVGGSQHWAACFLNE